MKNMKKAYIEEINKLLDNCDDVTLLDLVFQLMVKSMSE